MKNLNLGLIKLPMSYHLCTGLQVPAAYNSTLTEKCDSENNTFDDLVSSVYFFTYLVFGSMVIYENAKRKLDKGNSNVQRSLHILINNKLFFWRMTSCIASYQVCSLTGFIYTFIIGSLERILSYVGKRKMFCYQSFFIF